MNNENSEHIKRLAIYSFSDRDGRADDYIFRMLSELQNNVNYIVVVASGYLCEDSRKRFLASSDLLIERAPTGGRIGAFRESLFTFGLQNLEKYEELVFTDDTLFGPFFPLQDMFDAMSERPTDFWGIVKHHQFPGDPNGIFRMEANEEFIDPHFIVLKKKLFSSFYFKEYVLNRKDPKDSESEYTDFEKSFTAYFAGKKFYYDTYVNTARFLGITADPFIYELPELIREEHCPVAPRSLFSEDYLTLLNHNCGESASETLKVIRDETDYDEKLITDHLLRTCNLARLHQTLHMDFFLPSEETEHDFDNPYEGILFVFGSRERFEEVCYRYIPSIPQNMKTVFLDGDECYARKLCMAGEMAWRYQYACVLNLFDMTEGTWPHNNWASLLYEEAENLIPAEQYIGNVFDTFRKNANLGLLIPPVADFGIFFWKVGDGWEGYQAAVKKALSDLSVSVDVDTIVPHPLLPYGGSFWIRGDLLLEITSLPLPAVVPDEEAMEYLLPYLVQNERYLTGVLMSNDYAAIRMTNEDYKLRLNNRMIFKRFGTDCLQYELEKIRGTRQ